jgi:cytochrome P450
MIGNTTARLPEGPVGKPVIGSMLDFRRDPLAFLAGAAAEYGPVVRVRIANQYLFQINDAGAVQTVLQEKYRSYVKGRVFEPMRLLLGNGLATSEGSFWLRQRRLMQPEFHRQRIAAFAETMVSLTEALTESWAPSAELGKTLDVADEMTGLTMRIIAETMFGTVSLGEEHAVSEAITLLLEEIKFRYDVPFYPSLRWPTPRNRRAKKAMAQIDEAMDRIIDERRRGEPRGNLLDMLMAVRDADTGEGMTDRQLRDEVVTIFTAGHETTAVLLTWTFYLLATHLEVEARVRAELAEVLPGRLPTFQDVPRLVYMRRVLDETLRMYPPAWITNRECLEEDELCGFRIPAGSFIAISPWVIHRLPHYWPDPDHFDPDRFLPERSAARPKFAYLPFGGGPHQCIGNQFALTEAALVLATIFQRYKLALPEGAAVAPSAKTSLRPDGGLPMRIEFRQRGAEHA